jgi:mannitol-1-phosphate 5-dehydrogenase
MNKRKKKLIQFGAGNIGRSFIGQIFSKEGYEVVFIDVNENLISELNNKNEYKVIIKRNNMQDTVLQIGNVRAIHAREIDRIKEEIVTADLISSSVGKGALNKIFPTLSKGLELRYNDDSDSSIDIIIAENIRNGAGFFRDELYKNLPKDFPIGNYVGLVETSIGKMVPIMKKEDIDIDPLWVFAEPYNQLILDKQNVKNQLPSCHNIMLVNNISAYVDRKLYIHNLGHAAAAYFGFLYQPSKEYLYQLLEDEEIVKKIRKSMNEAASALYKEYPLEFTYNNLQEHIEDLIGRFQNKALCDTVFRVGRDLSRKMDNSDRLIGAILLCRKHNLPCNTIISAAAAGFCFKATDENNELFEPDKEFFTSLDSNGINNHVQYICHLNPQKKQENDIINEISLYYNKYKQINSITNY